MTTSRTGGMHQPYKGILLARLSIGIEIFFNCIDCTATTEVVICHPVRSEGSSFCNCHLNYYFILLLVHRFLALLGMTLCVLCTRQRSVILSERQ